MRRCSCALAWLLLVAVTTAQAERLPIRVYTVEDGLAHARVRRIVRDSRGFLWFCTIDGLSRFDGTEFVTYRTADGLPDAWVTDLLTTRDGTYWVATNGGIAKSDGTRRVARDGRRPPDPPGQLFSPVPFEGPPTQHQVRVLLEDRAGRVWAGGRGGLFVLDRSSATLSFRPTVPGPTAQVTSLVESVDGGMWVGTLDGLFHRFASGDVLPEPTAARAGIRNVRALAVDADGRLWVGHDGGLLVLGPGAAWRPAPSAPRPLRPCGAESSRKRQLRLPSGSEDACNMTLGDGLIDLRVRALAVGADGRVRVGTVSGLSVIDDAQITNVTQAHGLVQDAINSVTEDADGNVWIGTDTSGAARIAAFGLVSYFQTDGLRHDHVPSLIEDDAGRVIAVSGSFLTINEFAGRGFASARFNVPTDVPDDRYFSVLRDHQGAWWLGTPMGLYRFPPVRRLADLARVSPDAHYARLSSLPSDDLFPLFEDARGDIWLIAQLSDHVRLVRWRRATNDFQTYGASEGLAGITSRPAVARPAIVETPAGQLFFGFRDAGLFAYRDGRFEAILDKGESFAVGSLHIDRLGRIWIAGVDGAVRRIDNPSTRSMVNDTKVATSLVGASNVRCIVEDASGRLYFGTTSGIIEVDPETGDTRRYTTAEGLAKNEVWSGLASRRGDIWFGTIAGVSRLDATRVHPRPPTARALITTVHVNGVARHVSELGDHEISELTLAPSERGLAIRFFALTYAAGEHLRYQYRLDGAETDWSQPSTARVVNYSQLAPGRYRFRVRAVTSAGLAGVTPATMEFVILRPIWQRSWFRASVVFGLTLLLLVGHRYRVARLLETERVRTRIASDLHDDIGSSLSQIAILSEVARTSAGDDARIAAPLGRIATLSRESVDAMGDIVWAIDPHRDTPTHLAQRMRRLASDVLSACGIEVRFEMSDASQPTLGADVRREVFLIFKEALHNITRHAQAARVEIVLSIARHRLALVVQDDGCGFDPARARHGQGLRSMARRAEGLGGTLAVTSSQGAGARLVVTVPL
jgi:ligand-binding sensor domain-containing protein/signal transduction histidine kinase